MNICSPVSSSPILQSDSKIPSFNIFRQTFCESIVDHHSQTSMPFLYSTVIDKCILLGDHNLKDSRGSSQQQDKIIEDLDQDQDQDKYVINVVLTKIDQQLKKVKKNNGLGGGNMNKRTSLMHQLTGVNRSAVMSKKEEMEKENKVMKGFERGKSYCADYSSDEVLKDVREENRTRIMKIKESWKDIKRGGAIPARFLMEESVPMKSENYTLRVVKQEENKENIQMIGSDGRKVESESTNCNQEELRKIEFSRMSSFKPSSVSTRNSSCYFRSLSMNSRSLSTNNYQFFE